MDRLRMRWGAKGFKTEVFVVALAVLVMCIFSFSLKAKKKRELNKVNDVRVEQSDKGTKVIISTTIPPTYSVYRPLQPELRLWVDIADAEFSTEMPTLIEINQGGVAEVKLSSITGDNTSIARVEIGLTSKVKHDAKIEDGKLVVMLEPSEEVSVSQGATVSDLYPTAKETGKVIVEEEGEEAGEELEEEAKPLEKEKVPLKKVPSSVKGKLAGKLLDIVVKESLEESSIYFVMDGEPGDFNAFKLDNPPRLVIDLWKIRNFYPDTQILVNSQGIKGIRLGQHSDKLRLVLDAVNRVPNYRFDRQGVNLVITFSELKEIISEPTPQVVGIKREEVSVAEEEFVPEGAAKVLAVDFKYTPLSSLVIIKTDRPVRFEKKENPGDKIVSIIIKNAVLPKELERSLDTTEFQSPINFISSFQSNTTPPEVNITINLNSWVRWEVKETNPTLTLSFENPAVGLPEAGGLPEAPGVAEAASVSEEVKAPLPPIATVGVPTGEAVKVETATGGLKVYKGVPIYLDAKDMEIIDALRLIAEVSGLNIIASEKVKGKITMKLDNVPWDQALDLILDTKDLGMVQYGNVIRIAPKKDLQDEQKALLEAQAQKEELRPLQTKIIPVNYASASRIEPMVKKLLSKRGSSEVDARTNTIILKDIPEKLEEAQMLISALDTRTPQVQIEARIVEASVGVTRELGVQWGINYAAAPQYGNPTGYNFPYSLDVGGAVLGGITYPTLPQNLAAVGAQGGALGMTVGSLTKSISLDLLLKSLETQNKVKIISSPRVLTMDNEKASIQQGVTIPYPPAINLATGAGGGTNWQFVEAALRLEVTPHVSSDGMVVLDVKASNNEPNLKVVSGGAPSIDKKEAQTQILVGDGETAVIGGIYKTKESETTNRVPFLGKLPIIGALFKDTFTENSRNELLIFITPRIIR